METWVAVFVIVAAVAIVLQMLILAGMYLQIKQLSERMNRVATDLQGKMEPILTRLNLLLEDMHPRLSSATADAAEIAHIARIQAERLDRIFAEGMDRLRLQVIRADQMITGTLEQIEDTGAEMKRTLLGPVRQVSALLKGISAGIDFLRTQKRAPERVREHQDEELFI